MKEEDLLKTLRECYEAGGAPTAIFRHDGYWFACRDCKVLFPERELTEIEGARRLERWVCPQCKE